MSEITTTAPQLEVRSSTSTARLSPWETSGDTLKHQLTGAMAGISRALVGHPFDTVKVKMQTHPELYRSSMDALYVVMKTEGVRGLYRGVTAPVVGNAFISSIQFSVFNHFHQQSNAMIAGALAGAAGSLIASPVEYIRIKMQLANRLDNKKSYKGVLDCANHIVHQNGFNPFALYRGLGITMARESIGYAAFFSAYALVKDVTGIKLVDDTIRGIACGVALWGSMYPLDSIKSRIQGALLTHRHHGVLWHARDIYRTLGISGFFRGFDVTMLRAVPVNIAIILTVETCKLLH